MKAQVITLRNPCDPGQREHRAVRRRRKVSALAPRTRQPVIAYHNGRVILRREWHRRVNDGDVVAFVVLPMGGGGDGGKNPLQIVASLALMYFAPGMGASLYSAMGGTFVMANAGLAVSAISGAISLVGNALISSAFAGKPSLPSPQQASGTAGYAAPSPTYNLQAQGNMARLDAAIPVQYGRMMAYPDFAAQPYSEFAGNEQYLYQLLCLGQGYYEVEAIRIEDTSIASFSEIDYEIIAPGGTLTIFPSNVTTSGEVAGQELTYNTYIGPYVANAAGTSANAIAVDVVCPRGLFYANDSGGLDQVSISFIVEARTIDSGGTPTGSYVEIGAETVTAATNTPQRYSFRYSVSGARYEVRVKRTSAAGGSTRYGDDLAWAGLRAYLPETRTWAGQTVIAMRMRASNNLSAQASRKVNVIATRKLPIYDTASGTWTAPQITRSPAWAMADILRADYGGNLADERIDIDQLVTLAATYASRGDTFDGRFDSALTLWEALCKVGQAVRTKPYIQGGVTHFVRDQAASVPVALFSMRNIVKGSFSVDYLMPTEETADAIDVGYFDGDVWQPRRVTASLPASSEAVPLKVELFGVTSRQQAYQEGVYLAAVNRYRRKRITFATEMEGFIPAFGDLIAIAHDMPAWGTSGELVSKPHQNELSWSEDISGHWTANAVSVGSGATPPAPFSASTRITETVASDYHWVKAPTLSSNGSTQVFAAVVKAAGRDWCAIQIAELTGTAYAFFNLATVAVGTTAVGTTTQIDDLGGGWCLVQVQSAIAFAGAYPLIFVVSGDGAGPYAGTPGLGIDVAGAFLKTGTGFISIDDYAATMDLSKTLYLSEPVTFGGGTHYLGLRDRDGSVAGPYVVTAGVDDRQVQYSGTLDLVPYTGGHAERTHFSFGAGETWRQAARVVSVQPRGLNQVEIEAINEDASVHTADSGVTAPAVQSSSLVTLYTRPVVAGLTVRGQVNDPATMLVSWQSAPGARSYVIDVSSDGDTWTRAGETTSNNYPIPAVYGNATLVRVAGFGFTLGPFVQVSYSTYSDYMWSAVDTDLMWSATATDLMWSA